MTIGEIGKGFADIAHLHMRRRQIVCQQPPVLALDHGLFSLGVWREFPCGHHHMGMNIADIALALGNMNGEVDGSTVTICQILGKGTGERQASVCTELMRKSDLESRQRGYRDDAPPLLLRSKCRRSSAQSASTSAGKNDLGMNHALLGGKSWVRPSRSFVSRLAVR